jgi:hypothetical protein
VILGSNIFNLAALLGVSAVLAVRVAVAPASSSSMEKRRS